MAERCDCSARFIECLGSSILWSGRAGRGLSGGTHELKATEGSYWDDMTSKNMKYLFTKSSRLEVSRGLGPTDLPPTMAGLAGQALGSHAEGVGMTQVCTISLN